MDVFFVCFRTCFWLVFLKVNLQHVWKELVKKARKYGEDVTE